MTTRQIVRFFVKYKYQAIFPIAFLECPIITIISGFLVSRGTLAFVPALLVVFFGDFLSDTMFYAIGKGGRHAMQYVKFIRISDERLQHLEYQFHNHPWKTMIVSKVAYGLGMVFMVAAGASKMIWKKFLAYMGALNLIRSTILLAIGYYFGKAAIRNGSAYLQYYAIGIIVLLAVSYFIFRKKYK